MSTKDHIADQISGQIPMSGLYIPAFKIALYAGNSVQANDVISKNQLANNHYRKPSFGRGLE
jgi:hypothetical protein